MVSKASFAKMTLFLILSLVALSLGRRVWKNLESARRIEGLGRELEAAKEKNKRLKAEFAEKEGLEFVEKEAREKLGMVREGEKVLILPKKEEEKEEASALGYSRKIPYWREWVGVFGW